MSSEQQTAADPEEVVKWVLAEGDLYGRTESRPADRIIVEFVSAHPNGPITLAGGRSAVIGDVVSALLEANGHIVAREFYVNDAVSSAQLDNFGRSVYYRYSALLDRESAGGPPSESEPEWLYPGDYVTDVARSIYETYGRAYQNSDIEDQETILNFRRLSEEGMIAHQKADLDLLRVRFDRWFSESDLHADGRVARALEDMRQGGHTYEKDGAVWLRSTDFGDERDRVLIRADKTPTYIAGDAAYHKDKFDRGYTRLINVWGADHEGYVARTKAAIAALGYDPEALQVVLYRPLRVVREGELVYPSNRTGDALELKADLIEPIGVDAARFFCLLRPAGEDIELDLDLAVRPIDENPLHRVRKAYALVACSAGSAIKANVGIPDLVRAVDGLRLIALIGGLPAAVEKAARFLAPDLLTRYVVDLADEVIRVFSPGAGLRAGGVDCSTSPASSALARAAHIALTSALAIMRVDAPDRH